MKKIKRYQDVEDIIYDMMDSGLENSDRLEIKNEYHSDGASDYIITDEILMTREISEKEMDYSITDSEAKKEINEINEIIEELLS